MHFLVDQALYIWMNFNARIPEVHLCGPLTQPDHRVDLLNTGADIWEPNALVQYITYFKFN